MSRIGIIGGTGTYTLELKNSSEVEVDTPFGPPSDSIQLGNLEGQEVAFLPRHGRHHQLLPHEINYRANIYALKSLGVDRLISVCTAGSLIKEIHPGMIVVPDQLIDWTKRRASTFFGNGIGAYADMSDPFCPVLSKQVSDIIKNTGIDVHTGGTYLCIEGPQFSTRAESGFFASIGAHCIGMTAQPEAKLAREAEICYTTVAGISDYNVCGMSSSRKETMQNMHRLLKDVNSIVTELIRKLPPSGECACSHALRGAVITSREGISQETLENLSAILGKYHLEDRSGHPHGTVMK
ncbi:MAG: S-methyl-5'-thioadenosine phosphorylase [Methanosarcinales archaeon]|nr:S-methyl-5'-thioadenosine phosphorylase [ANME-2 cluster archaeon]MDW7775775.1 S-methyl-5'-thioadenosine phosphorylase [Methanosarcinales archaeon]